MIVGIFAYICTSSIPKCLETHEPRYSRALEARGFTATGAKAVHQCPRCCAVIICNCDIEDNKSPFYCFSQYLVLMGDENAGVQ